MDVAQKNLKHVDCILKYVKVKTVDKRFHQGWLKTIDPLTGNLILVTLKEEIKPSVENIILIIASNLNSVEVVKETDPKIKTFIQNMHAADTYLLTDDALERKERLEDWIKLNRLPLQDAQNGRDLIICESVTVHPPYTTESCSSTNGRVLMMIRNLVNSVPEKEQLAGLQPESSHSSDEDVGTSTVESDT